MAYEDTEKQSSSRTWKEGRSSARKSSILREVERNRKEWSRDPMDARTRALNTWSNYPCYVYLVCSADREVIKVGHTYNPKQRMVGLRASFKKLFNKEHVDILALWYFDTWVEAVSVEEVIVKRYRNSAIKPHGEFIRPSKYMLRMATEVGIDRERYETCFSSGGSAQSPKRIPYDLAEYVMQGNPCV